MDDHQRRPLEESNDDEALYAEICQLLLDSGYFRVQIATLTPFDKIVGGLTWACTWMGMDVDLGAEVLQFREDANIGYKIALAEKLAVVLGKLDHVVEPHQIQGLDYRRLHSILSLLLARVRDVRVKYGNVHLQYALYLYRLKFGLDEVELDDDERVLLLSMNESRASPINRAESPSDAHLQDMQVELEFVTLSIDETSRRIAERETIKEDLEQQLNVIHLELAGVEDNAELKERLASLLDTRNQLRTDMQNYKKDCKARMKDIKKQIASLKDVNSVTLDRGDALESVREQRAKISDLDRQLFELELKLDQMPGSLELQQCQRRFMELYQQMSGKLIELRQGYTTYNTLESIREQLSKEMTLLKSVYENILKAKSKPNQDKLVASLSQWLQTGQENLIRIEGKREDSAVSRDAMQAKHSRLLELQNRYYRAIRQFQELCRTNQY